MLKPFWGLKVGGFLSEGIFDRLPFFNTLKMVLPEGNTTTFQFLTCRAEKNFSWRSLNMFQTFFDETGSSLSIQKFRK